MELSARTILDQSLRDFRRTWPQLILTDLLARVLGMIVLTPVVGLLLFLFLATTATGVVTDGATVGFLLHPIGLSALLIVGAVALGILFAETGQLMVIGFGSIEDRRATWLEALKYAFRRVRALIELAGFGVVRLLPISLPFLAAVGALYWFLLRTYDINWREAPAGEDDAEHGFSVNRTRIFFEGQYTPKFDYHFRINIDDEGDFSLLVAYVLYNIGEKWNVRGGRQFIAMSREDWMLPQDTLTTEFSPNDFTFALGTSTGIQANYQAERTRLWFSVNDGAYGAKKDFPNNETTDVALTGRWEYQIAGRDWSVWDDFVGRRGRPRGILLGLAGGYQVEEDTSAFDRSAQLNTDISFNGDGYHAMVAGSWTWRDPVTADSFSNYGLLVQGGYFVAKHWQVYGQYNFISPGDQAGTPTCSPPQCDPESFNSITGGVSYFPFLWTNRWKFSAEVGHLFDALNKMIVEPSESLGWLASNEAGQTYFRIQAQFGF